MTHYFFFDCRHVIDFFTVKTPIYFHLRASLFNSISFLDKTPKLLDLQEKGFVYTQESVNQPIMNIDNFLDYLLTATVTVCIFLIILLTVGV
jgi:hypothetical protein